MRSEFLKITSKINTDKNKFTVESSDGMWEEILSLERVAKFSSMQRERQ